MPHSATVVAMTAHIDTARRREDIVRDLARILLPQDAPPRQEAACSPKRTISVVD